LSERPRLSPDLTDVIVRRGDRDVVRRAAGNAAPLARSGRGGAARYRAAQGPRPPAGDVVKPERRLAIAQAMDELSAITEQVVGARDFVPAQRAILALHHAGGLNEAALLDFAKSYRYEESVTALAAILGIRIATLDRLISSDRHDPILIVGKALGLEWATVRALILLRLGPNRIVAPADIESCRVKFARLMPSTAERVVSFWKSQQAA
jgi:uncharacterized protein (DUF2336 family)